MEAEESYEKEVAPLAAADVSRSLTFQGPGAGSIPLPPPGAGAASRDHTMSSDYEDAITRITMSNSGDMSARESLNSSTSSRGDANRSSSDTPPKESRSRKEAIESMGSVMASTPVGAASSRSSPRTRQLPKEGSFIATPNSGSRPELDSSLRDPSRTNTPLTPSTPYTRDDASFGQGRSTILSSTGSSRDSRKSNTSSNTPSQFLSTDDPGWGDATGFLPLPFDRTSFPPRQMMIGPGSPNNFLNYTTSMPYFPMDSRALDHPASSMGKKQDGTHEYARTEFLTTSSPLHTAVDAMLKSAAADAGKGPQ